jgi:hypothetical protein
MKTVADELETITLGDPAHFGSLTIFPLFRPNPVPSETDYVLLDEAIAAGTARVAELGVAGVVPELRFENLGDKPVLLFDGEELVGARQNRALNLTILAPAKQTIVIPVSCVEAGRWQKQSEHFRPAQHVMYSRARASRAVHVTASMLSSGLRRSDQAAVWADIASKSQRLDAVSPTQAMSAIYETHAASVDAYVRAFSWTDQQMGVLFAIGPDTLGFDLLDRPESMRKVFPKLLRSYALDAVEVSQSAPVERTCATDFLARFAHATTIERPALGLGKDVRIVGEGIAGAGLSLEPCYVHLCGFTTANPNGGPAGFGSRFSRPATRRTR